MSIIVSVSGLVSIVTLGFATLGYVKNNALYISLCLLLRVCQVRNLLLRSAINERKSYSNNYYTVLPSHLIIGVRMTDFRILVANRCRQNILKKILLIILIKETKN